MQRLTSHLTATNPAGGWLQRAWSELAARWRSPLFRKYAGLLFTMLAGLLIANAAIQMYYAWRESRAAISSVQREKAQGAAAVIEQFLKEIEGQVGWTTHANVLSGATGIDQRRFDFLRLLRQAPAVTELTHIDAEGREQLKVSRLAMDVTGSGADYTNDPRFVAAKAQRRHVSTVYFRKESEPYLTLSIAGQGRNAGVTIAEVNLKFIWDVISRIEVGKAGVGYVVDQGGLLIAHPDIGLVLRKTDMSGLGHVAAARVRLKNPRAPLPETGRDRHGQDVLTASAPIPSLGWLIMVDQPLAEALTPVRGTLNRSLLVLLGGLTLAVLGGLWLARRMAVPINALAEGAERMGAGDLDHRIDLKTGDEIERLGQAFNDMGARLKESYAGLERKVDERTQELAESLEYQTAVSDVLGVIARAPGELQPVLDRILTTAARLCEADMGLIHVQRGEVVQPEASFGYTPQIVEEYRKLRLAPGQGTVSGRALASGRTAQIEDVLAEPGYELLDVQRIGGHRTTIAVPLKRGAATFGLINLSRRIVRPFTPAQIALVETFADQAVIAIENARLFEAEQTRTKELVEALEYQTATSEVLSVISKSPDALEPVFQTMLDNAVRVCGASFGNLLLYDGEKFRHVALHNAPRGWIAEQERDPVPPRDLARVLYRVPETKQRVHIADLMTVNPDEPIATKAGARTLLIVPMLKQGELVGVIAVYRQEVRPFTEKQIELIDGFAKQAVIAIENARLLAELQTRQKELESRTNELTESLEYQTATAEVLAAISRSPNELQPVLDTIAQTARRLCHAERAAIRLLNDGKFHLLAADGSEVSAVFETVNSRVLIAGDRGSITGRVAVEGRTVHVHDVQADPDFMLDRDRDGEYRRTMLGVPLLRNDGVVGTIALSRSTVMPFTDREVALVETFADQAVIAIENARLFEAEQTRTKELRESLEYQTAISDVLGVISRSPTELQPVLDAIATTAHRICEAERGTIWQLDGDRLHVKAHVNLEPDYIAYLCANPIPSGQGSVSGRAIASGKVQHVTDVQADPKLAGMPQLKVGGQRTMLSVPLLRAGQAIGTITMSRREVRPFTPRQIALVETFADQAVIAIENARLFEAEQTRTKEVEAKSAELTESLEYQTAISEVLGVISRSPDQVQPVLDSIAGTAKRLCEARSALIWRPAGDVLELTAHTDMSSPERIAYLRSHPIKLDGAMLTSRAFLERRTFHVLDVMAEPELARLETNRTGQQRSVLCVPLLRRGEAVGVIALTRRVVSPFTERQIDLVTTFANQAVIAIENARLFEAEQTRTKELQESLEYQTATSDVLGVIARSPGDIQPVFEEILTTASRLCRADSALLFRVEGEHCHTVASNNVKSGLLELLRANPVPVAPESITGRAAHERRTIHVPDELEAPEFASRRKFQQSGGQRTILAVPLIHEGKAIGVITLFRFEVDPFTQRQIDLVTTFANQAVIAINNVDLFEAVQTRTKELARSVEELQSLGAVSRSVSATLDMSQVLETVLENACRMAYAGGGTVYVYDKEAGEFRLEAGHNMSESHIQRVREQPIRMGDAVVGECGSRREVVQVADLQAPDAPRTSLIEILIRDGVRAILAVPLLHQGEVIGALVIRRTFPGAFSPEIVGLLEAFAAQSATAVNNARLFKDIEEKGRQLELASQHKSQFLANMSHELRTPLNAILGYTELLTDGTYGDLAERPKGVLERIDRNGKHLLGLINDVLDLSKIEAGEMQLALEDYALGSLVQNTITVTEPLARQKGLELRASIAPNLPLGRGDARRLSQVLLNLVGNAIKFTDTGRIDVTATLDRDQFHIAVTDTGPGIPPAEQAKIFEKFQQVDNTSTRRKGGSGLGLSISKELVEMHGGTIAVSSSVGQGSTFEVRLPRRICPLKEAS